MTGSELYGRIISRGEYNDGRSCCCLLIVVAIVAAALVVSIEAVGSFGNEFNFVVGGRCGHHLVLVFPVASTMLLLGAG